MIPLRDDNLTSIKPGVTISLIVTNSLVFIWQWSLGPGAGQALVFALGMIPVVLFDQASLPPELHLVPAEMTVLTSMFLHGGWMHLLGNMLYLWVFGNNVEDSMGHGRFIVFYLLCGICAALAQALVNPLSEIPMIGASGAISGILGAYLLLYPHARIMVLLPLGFFITTVYLPASLVLIFWFVLQLFSSAAASSASGDVAFVAHIGGFVAGMAMIPLFKDRRVSLLAPAHNQQRR